MPLIRIDVIEGWAEGDLEALMDEVHAAVVEAFSVPERDRYQILQCHPAGRVRLQDTGLGFQRTDRAVVISVTSRRRGDQAKQKFYRIVADRLSDRLGLPGTDLLVDVIENGDADWSFTDGEAQFVTGALA
jgi:phenylpyruvate tautomerase PptA (4-oxalocrotonate tautomerase family)